ncbi:MAG: type IV secretory system conjugative DNA transfer family protein, partial [Gemmatimonadota bacterium]
MVRRRRRWCTRNGTHAACLTGRGRRGRPRSRDASSAWNRGSCRACRACQWPQPLSCAAASAVWQTRPSHFLDSPRMARALARSTVDFGALKRERMSVYLVMPAERLDGYARWLRLMIACAILALTREPGQPQERVLMLLDEFAHLRRLQPVQQGIGLMSGYGVTFWLVIQDLSQLRSTYPDTWPTFLANVDVLQAFGVNDWDTAEYVSKMTGETTVEVASENLSTGVSGGPRPQRQRGAALTVSETGRRLLTPDEIRRLPRSQQLLFVKGMAPLLVERLDYL